MNALPSFGEKLQDTRAILADTFARHQRVFVAFSGGKESLTLAHLCAPWRWRFQLVWVNTGFTFPHVEGVVREQGERFGLVELRGDLLAAWHQDGLPTWLPPVANAMPAGEHKEPKLQSWLGCCQRVRAAPLFHFVAGQVEPAAFLHGQRHQDGAPGNGMSGWQRPASVDILAPLADWSTAEVMAYAKAEGIELPEHYAEIPDGLDCSICPAALGEHHGPQRVAYMARRYPELLRALLPGVRRSCGAARLALDAMERSVNAADALAAGRSTPAVLQSDPDGGDCAVAALATALDRTYAEAAALLGLSIDPVTGATGSLKGRGLDMLTIAGRLLRVGIAATPVLVAEGAASSGRLDADAVRALLPGRRALVIVTDERNGSAEHHALAWTGSRLIDCRGPAARELRLPETPIIAALVLTEPARAAL